MKKLLSLPLVLLLALLCGCAASGGTGSAAAPTPAAVSAPAPTFAAVSAPAPTPAPAPTFAAVSTPAPLPSALPAAPTPGGTPDFEQAVAGQTFAVTMAAYSGAFPDGTLPDSDEFLMEATGWYAAWRWRTGGVELLGADEAEAFQHSLGRTGGLLLDPDWTAYGVVRRAQAPDGTEGLDFTLHKQALEEQLGVTLELRTGTGDAPAVDTAVVRHFENGDTAEKSYRLLFAPGADGDARFPYRLTDLRFPPAGPQMDPDFDFDWELLMRQNRLSTLAKLCAAIRIEYSYDPGRVTWIMDRGGELCILNETDGVVYGEYRGMYFEYGPDAKGVTRARVTSVSDGAGSWEENDAILTDLFSMAAVMHCDGTDGERSYIRSTSMYGFRQDFEINRGTLALLTERYYFDGDEPVSTVTVSYLDEQPDFAFLKGWDKPLRQVTGVWEDWYDGAQHVRREEYYLPGDWEFLPWEGVYGDYTIYMNAGYTRSYFYPGDGMDYTLYLTTAKG